MASTDKSQLGINEDRLQSHMCALDQEVLKRNDSVVIDLGRQ
jgi:hypothetical protein